MRFLVAFCLVAACTLSVEAARPNVVLILTDNHGAWTLGCYGNPDIRTPNIDALATEGTLFTRAFASNPVCSPTRATLLTGLVPSQHGVHSFLSGGRLQVGPDARCTLDEFTSLPEVLREEGYACGLVGKWHLGDNLRPQEGLDDYWITMPHGGTSTFYDAQIIENGSIRKEPKYLTDLWTEHALNFIGEQATSEEPFFLFLAYNGPYALSRLLLRDGQNRHAEYYADKEVASFPRVTPHPWQLNNLDYINNPTSIRRVATEVSGIDDGVGEVMKALKAHGLDDNTIVIFVADQGWVGGHGGFFGMGDHTRPLTARDGMMQIPLIWRHPKQIAAGRRSDQMIANYDVMPTLLGHLELSDKMPTSPKSPGRDFSQLLEPQALASGLEGVDVDSQGPAASAVGSARRPAASAVGSEEDAIYYEFENLRCVRTTTHKYVHRHPNGPHELYDLENDPDEFMNLVDLPEQADLRLNLKSKLDGFFAEHSLPKYDMWNGGTSQVRIHDGIDEELAQLVRVQAPSPPAGYQPAPIDVPEGYSVTLAAAPPLVTHPTMACFDDRGRLYVCNNAGVNMTNDELEKQLPNAIRRLEDRDGDGTFDSWTTFADKMTFPMGGVWHDGSLYVASPPNIWKLTDVDDDGVADERQVIVNKFGYNGNAASIHGCFLGPDGRIYWTDGYHGHELKDAAGKVTSERAGSYLFSCRTDGSDSRIHCGGGMDNPVEIDFTTAGDMLGTVNILYTRPRVDCLVHWLYGGAYPHREKVLGEIKVTGEFLGPAHRFGHVAVSGMTRYRSGAMDYRWGDDLLVTFFNQGKVVRLDLQPEGSTYTATQHEFVTSTSREFHPTDVLEDADGSLLVVDTGGWFYRGCPTSQFSKPELLGGIYRIRRDGMTGLVDPRGLRIDWQEQTPATLVRLFNDTRFEVRRQAIEQCAERGSEVIPTLKSNVVRGDIRVRNNCVWTLARLVQRPETADAATAALRPALQDRLAAVRQSTCRALAASIADVDAAWMIPLLDDPAASVRRQAATALGRIGDPQSVQYLIRALDRETLDRSEEHAIVYAMIEINDEKALRSAIKAVVMSESQLHPRAVRGALVTLDQMDGGKVDYDDFATTLMTDDPLTLRIAAGIANKHPQWAAQLAMALREALVDSAASRGAMLADTLLPEVIHQEKVAAMAGKLLVGDSKRQQTDTIRAKVLGAIGGRPRSEPHPSWIDPLRRFLASDNEQLVATTLTAVTSLSGDHFNQQLHTIVDDSSRPIATRMDALAAMQPGRLDGSTFDRLIGFYRDSPSPTARTRAAQIIGAAQLTAKQLPRITPLLADASPIELRDLIRGFGRKVDKDTAEQFLNSMSEADALMSLSEIELSEVIKRFPPDSLEPGNRLLDRLKQHRQQKLLQLERLRDRLDEGDAERGKIVFAGEKAKCSSCHKLGPTGKAIGPDLTTIGANRSPRDLLESIVFPSASIVRDYQSHKIVTVDGRVLTGLVAAESTESIDLQQAAGETISIRHDDIEMVAPDRVSLMPAGLDEALTESQLLDVVKYLQGLR